MTIRKGDIVAVQQFKGTTYMIGSGISGTLTEEWSLALVTSATREGVARVVQFQGGTPTKLAGYHGGAPKVWTLGEAETQAAAKRLYDGERRTWIDGAGLKVSIFAEAARKAVSP